MIKQNTSAEYNEPNSNSNLVDVESLDSQLLSQFSSLTLKNFEIQGRELGENLASDAWNESLVKASPEIMATACYDYAVYNSAKNNPLLSSALKKAYGISRFHFPTFITHGLIRKKKLTFTHDQSIFIINASLSERHEPHKFERDPAHYKFELDNAPFSYLRNLSKAIERPDAILAGKLWHMYRVPAGVALILTKLCPLEKTRKKPKYVGTSAYVAMCEAKEALKFAMIRKPNLWVTLSKDSSTIAEWSELNHQIFPYHAEIRSWIWKIEASTQLGENINEHRSAFQSLFNKAQENYELLKNGYVNDRDYDDVKMKFPIGQRISSKSPYWSTQSPDWQRDMFLSSGKVNLPAVKHAEEYILNQLAEALKKMPEVKMAEVEPKAPPVAPKNASRPTKAWLADIQAQYSTNELRELLTSLKALKPFNPYNEIVENALNQNRQSPRVDWDLETQKRQGLIWAAHLLDEEAGADLYDISLKYYAKLPGIGITHEKLGNAAVVSLGLIEDGGGIPFLTRLQSQISQPKIRNHIGRELDSAAKKAGISRLELEELSVEDYSLANGIRQIKVGESHAELSVDKNKVILQWADDSGKVQKSAPKVLKDKHPDDIKRVRSYAKTIGKDLVVQRNRLERLYLTNRSWDVSLWIERYAEHGTMAVLSRGLLWTLEHEEVKMTFLLTEDGYITLSGNKIDLVIGTIRLWHPSEDTQENVQAWRQRLLHLNLVQPFRQVWRETFVLTDAERKTATYSNRFSGHVLRQHQMMALAHANNWQCSHRVGFDTPSDEPTYIRLKEFGLQAEYWTGIAGLDGPTSGKGAYLYIFTDRLQFHQLDEKVKYGRGEEVKLTSIPPRVLSEIMRACDLFVSVSSIGLDPEWQDKGANAQHPSKWQNDADQYWDWSQSAPLIGSSKTRHEMLAVLIPNLKPENTFHLEANSLHVTGKLHNYIIHLGSGGVQKADTRKHICIIPNGRQKNIALPFNEDGTLSLILSKAIMLANDDKIMDRVILQQLQ